MTSKKIRLTAILLKETARANLATQATQTEPYKPASAQEVREAPELAIEYAQMDGDMATGISTQLVGELTYRGAGNA